MNDSDFIFSIFLCLFMLLAAFQQVRIVRLRRKIEKIAEASAVRQATTTIEARSDSPEMVELRKRVQVLERIATDGSPRLDAEFEELRRA
jgi:hypothetical protein